MNNVSFADTFMGPINGQFNNKVSAQSSSRQDTSNNFIEKLSKAQKEVRNLDSNQVRKEDEYKKNTKVQKEQNNPPKVNKQQSKEVKEKINNDSSEIEKELDQQEVDEQILNMLSQVFQMPIEEIKDQLIAMKLEVQDLLTEEGFGQFISQVLGQGDINTLLLGSVDVKKLSQLFEELSELKEHVNINLPESQENIEIVRAEENTTSEILNEFQSVMAEENLEAFTENSYGKQNDKYDGEGELHLSFLAEGEEGTNKLGLTVPIHHFTTTTFTQTVATQTGTVTQTITTKQAANGQAFIEQVDFKVLSQTKELNVSLSPKELGNMNIKIVENNGAMVAEIKVDNEKAKEFILNNIHELKDNLEEQGLNVADVKVDIKQDNRQSQMEQERQKSSKRIQEIISKHLNDATLEEVEDNETPILSDSEVDYMV